MNRKYKDFTIILLLGGLYLGLFLFPDMIMQAGSSALTIFKEKLFPSIFPFFVLSFLLLNLGFAEKLSKLVEPLMMKIFHIQGKGAFVLLASIISGFPSGAKTIAALYQEKKLTKEEANYLLFFTHFANPLFVLGTCGILLGNQNYAYKIFICQLLSNFILGILLRPKLEKKKYSLETSNQDTSNYSFLKALITAIKAAMDVLLFMLGSVTFFLFASQILLTFIDLPPFLEVIISGILDLTTGVSLTATIDVSSFFQAMIMLSFITFGSFSVHLQVINALQDKNLSYHNFLIGRIIQTAIALLLFLLMN